MLNQAIIQIQIGLIRKWLHEGDSRARDLIAESFWDYQIIRKFGIPKIPVPELNIPWPPLPQPDPSPYLNLNDEIVMGLIDIFASNTITLPSNIGGDPDPQPNISGLLGHRNARLAAAKSLAHRLNTATQLINKEIAQLEKSC